jgi:hypothetical protein
MPGRKEATMKWSRIVGILAVLLLTLVTPAAAQGPSVTLLAPADGATIEGASVIVEFKPHDITIVPSTVPVSEFGKRPDANQPDEGHLHLALDLMPLVIWDRDAPYTFVNVPPGEHLLKIELVNNDHSSRIPPVMQQVRFKTTVTPATMPVTGATTDPGIEAGLLALGFFLIVGGYLSRRRAM